MNTERIAKSLARLVTDVHVSKLNDTAVIIEFQNDVLATEMVELIKSVRQSIGELVVAEPACDVRKQIDPFIERIEAMTRRLEELVGEQYETPQQMGWVGDDGRP